MEEYYRAKGRSARRHDCDQHKGRDSDCGWSRTSQNQTSLGEKGTIKDPSQTKIEFYRSLHQVAGIVQSTVTTSALLNEVCREELYQFRKLPDHKQAEVVENGIKDFLRLLPKATSFGTNAIASVVSIFATMVEDKEIEEAFNLEDKKIKDSEMKEMYDE